MSNWQRSSFCNSTSCIEVDFGEHFAHVRDAVGHEIHATRDEWAAFIAGVKAGEFDGAGLVRSRVIEGSPE